MPMLSRNTKTLLHQLPKQDIVNREQDLDPERDPEESSEDELSSKNDIPLVKDRSAAAEKGATKSTASSRPSKPAPKSGRVAEPLLRPRSARQAPKAGSQYSNLPGKRKRKEVLDDNDDEDDDDLFQTVRDVAIPDAMKQDELSAAEQLEFSSQLGPPRSSQGRRPAQYSSRNKSTCGVSSPRKEKAPPAKETLTFKPPPIFGPGTAEKDTNPFKQPPDISTKAVKANVKTFKNPPETGNRPLREGSANPSVVRFRTPPPCNGMSSPQSSPPILSVLGKDDPISSVSSPASQSSPDNATTIPCPICRILVDRSVYNDFLSTSSRKRLTTRDKLRFCESHNAVTAQEKFLSADYPTIDWPALPRRLEKMNPTVQALLRQEIHSTYRDDLQCALRDGKTNLRHALRNPESVPAVAAATMSKSNANDDIITIPSSSAPLPLSGSVTVASSQTSNAPPARPKRTVTFGIAGYYGARGAKMIMDHVIQSAALSQKLREVSTTEKIYKALGVSGFVQAVIVPEIAWRLVREDMKLGGSEDVNGGRWKGDGAESEAEEEGERRAKEILVDSWEVGELVNHEEESEVIMMNEDEDVEERTIINYDDDDDYY